MQKATEHALPSSRSFRIRLLGDRLLWKRGVTERGPFADWALAMERESRGWWPFAYTMLETIAQSFQDDDEPLLQRLYESMRASDGVYKITRPGRFGALDGWLADWIGSQGQHDRRWFVHDMAASNGITSLELLRALAPRSDVHLLATDLFTEISIAEPPKTSWRVVFDADDRPLQFVGANMVISAYRREPLRFPVNVLLQRRLLRKLLPAAVRLLERSQKAAHADGTGVRRVSLFHPRCVREAAENPAFQLGRHSAFVRFGTPAHILRVMNFLTQRHLGDADFRTAARAAIDSVVEGGLLVQGRNADECGGELRATVFRKCDGRLQPLHDFGGGSEERARLIEVALS